VATEAERTEPGRVELKDPLLAALLAWLIPGLGHLYQGRTAKAVLYAVCILGTFAYGVYLGGRSDLGYGRAVYFSFRPGDRRLPFLCQVWAGLPTLPALIQANLAQRRKPPLWNGFMAPPRLEGENAAGLANSPTLNDLNKALSTRFELATVYTMVAGLLNILAIYDAWGGPVFAEKKEEDEEGQEAAKQPRGERKRVADEQSGPAGETHSEATPS